MYKNNEHILSNNQEKNKEKENNILDFMDLDEDDNINYNNMDKNGLGHVYLESQDNNNIENDFVGKMKDLEKKCHTEQKKKIKKKDIEDIRFNLESLYNKIITFSNLEKRIKMKMNSKKIPKTYPKLNKS